MKKIGPKGGTECASEAPLDLAISVLGCDYGSSFRIQLQIITYNLITMYALYVTG